ncbi:MAG: C_GCAxxG_C_C family protein [Clostridiales bacterium]|nr:C_GCAxxG_C_C family protein [Candidatus Coliplasma equi]
MDHAEKAIEYFNGGANCAQSVFAAYSDLTGIDETISLKLASSFGGGMGKLREVCGALTGAFAVVGALYGYAEHDQKAKEDHYALIQHIASEFKKEHKTYICRELLAGIPNTEGKSPAVRDAKYYAVRPCARFVLTACEVLDKVISEREKADKK